MFKNETVAIKTIHRGPIRPDNNDWGNYVKTYTNQTAILLLHGLGGGPTEMSFLKLFLEQKGFQVSVPVLPGHGTHYTDLKSIEWQQYAEAAKTAFLELKKSHEKVYISGICLGAVLALHLAAELGTVVEGVIPISTTLFYDGWSLPYIARFPSMIRLTPAYYFYDVKESFPFGVRDPGIRKWIAHAMSDNSTTHYSRVPFRSVWQMHLLSKKVRATLSKINCPVFAIHPRDDEVASLESARYIQSQVKSNLFQYLILENSFHLATLDSDKHLVAESIARFCTPYTEDTRAAA